jgi:hypothetical protein
VEDCGVKIDWAVHLDGEGHYFWRAETPIGPVVADFSESKPHGQRWGTYWYPFDQEPEQDFGAFKTEGEAKAAGAKAMRAVANKLRRALK